MRFKKLTLTVHLWLGLTSGLVVFIVGVTGCILAFRQEIETYSKPYLFVRPLTQRQLAPSALDTLLKIKLKAIDDTVKVKVLGLQYPGQDRAAIITYTTGVNKTYLAYLNPYTGAVMRYNQPVVDFFAFIEHGHRWLWFPYQIGRPIQSSFVLVFLVMMISGIMLWWPKRWTKSNRKKSFTINWKAKWKRVNYDLHNVLGFYMTWVLVLIVITGLSISMEWFQKGVYWVTSGGKQLQEFKLPSSDTTKAISPFTIKQADKLWFKAASKYHQQAELSYLLPAIKTAPVLELVNTMPSKTYRREFHYYDQYTLKDISAQSSLGGTYDQSGPADKLRRMNIDIHMGVIGGIATKIISFLASLVAASLPVTGFYIWWGKRKKKNNIHI